MVEGAEEPVVPAGLRMAVAADKEAARKVAVVGKVEHKDQWSSEVDHMAARLVHTAASFLAGHKVAVVHMRVADHMAVVHKAVHHKAAVHIAVVHIEVYRIVAAEVHTD